MDYLIIAFESRSNTLSFQQALARKRINSRIVNTPRDAGLGCGLSLKICTCHLCTAGKLLETRAFGRYKIIHINNL